MRIGATLGLILFSMCLKNEVPEENVPRLYELDKLTGCLYGSAIKNFPGCRIRTDMSDGEGDWEGDFNILRKSWCPAVLTENFFMDCKIDFAYLQSVEGKRAVVTTHVEGIVEYLYNLIQRA